MNATNVQGKNYNLHKLQGGHVPQCPIAGDATASPHHVAQHRPTTGSETTPTPPYAPRSSRFGSEPPSVEDDVDVWRYAIASCMPETTSMYGAMSGSVS